MDNISWKLNVATITEWLPDRDMLPPKQLRPSPIHILCVPLVPLVPSPLP